MIDLEYPLRWIVGRPRRPIREHADFGTRVEAGQPLRPMTVAGGVERLRDELRALRVEGAAITTNIPTRRDGLPMSAAREPDDPAVAVYFRLETGAHCLGADKWDRVADNLTAIAKHIQALRGQDRWGCGSMVQAFAGHKMLTPMEARKSWWQILGFKEPPPVFSTAEREYDRLIRTNHPDKGGNSVHAAEINAAWDEARTFYEASERQ